MGGEFSHRLVSTLSYFLYTWLHQELLSTNLGLRMLAAGCGALDLELQRVESHMIASLTHAAA